MPVRNDRLHYPCRVCGNMFPRYNKETLCKDCWTKTNAERIATMIEHKHLGESNANS